VSQSWRHVRDTIRNLRLEAQDTINHYNGREASGSVELHATAFLKAEQHFNSLPDKDLRNVGEPHKIKAAVNALVDVVLDVQGKWRSLHREENGMLSVWGSLHWKSLPPPELSKDAITTLRLAERVAWQLERQQPTTPKDKKSKSRDRIPRAVIYLQSYLDDRRNCGKSQKEMADALGLSECAVSKAFNHSKYGPNLQDQFDGAKIKPDSFDAMDMPRRLSRKKP